MMRNMFPFFKNNRVRFQKFLTGGIFEKNEKPLCQMTQGLLLISLYQTNDQQGTTTSYGSLLSDRLLYQTNDQQGTTTSYGSLLSDRLLYQTNDQQGTTTPLSFTIESFKLYQTNNKQGTTISYQLFVYARRRIYNSPFPQLFNKTPFSASHSSIPRVLGLRGYQEGSPVFPWLISFPRPL